MTATSFYMHLDVRGALNNLQRSRAKKSAPYRCAVCGFWHAGQNTGLKQPVKTIRNNHQLRFT
jgi:rubrerythrin